jgi:hypothetical protein
VKALSLIVQKKTAADFDKNNFSDKLKKRKMIMIKLSELGNDMNTFFNDNPQPTNNSNNNNNNNKSNNQSNNQSNNKYNNKTSQPLGVKNCQTTKHFNRSFCGKSNNI